MAFHTRPYREVWPTNGDYTFLKHYLIVNDEGWHIGVLQFHVEAPSDAQWGWSLAGMDAFDMKDQGRAESRDKAKLGMAEAYRGWLKRMGLDESHVPRHGKQLSVEDRRRLRLPI